ncbi:MAG: ATP-binding protein [Pseudomonadota bacterium]
MRHAAMTKNRATLYMIYGKIAAGKSTLAAGLARKEQTVLIALDDWLGALFGDQMSTGQDFMHFSKKLESVMGPHIIKLLQAGTSVVLDYPANTVEQRAHMRGLFEMSGAAHELHVLDVPDEVCLTRLQARNEDGAHPFAPTEAQFHAFSKHLVPPTEKEGFQLVLHCS